MMNVTTAWKPCAGTGKSFVEQLGYCVVGYFDVRFGRWYLVRGARGATRALVPTGTLGAPNGCTHYSVDSHGRPAALRGHRYFSISSDNFCPTETAPASVQSSPSDSSNPKPHRSLGCKQRCAAPRKSKNAKRKAGR